MKKELTNLKILKEMLFKARMKNAKMNRTEPWSREKILKVLKGLKKGKSRDPSGLAKLFHPDVAGDDLIDAIDILMNRIKNEQVYPEIMEFYNISSIFKIYLID